MTERPLQPLTMNQAILFGLIMRWVSNLPKHGRILAISGTMGAGKGILMRILLREFEGSTVPAEELEKAHNLLWSLLKDRGVDVDGLKFRLIPSYTTKPLRGDELSGEYEKVSYEELISMANEGDLAWAVPVGQYFYATRRKDFLSAIESKGVIGVMTATPQTIISKLEVTWVDEGLVIPVFLDSDQCSENMTGRGNMTYEEVQARDGENWKRRRLVKEARNSGRRFLSIRNDVPGNFTAMLEEVADVLSGYLVR